MSRESSLLEREDVQCAVLLTLAFLAFFAKLWEGPLGGDESCYALLARQILRSGDFWVLHHPTYTPWANFYEHPPLYMWITAGAFEVFGTGDFAAKFFSAVSGFGTIAALYAFGRWRWNHRFGLLAATALLTTLYFIDYGRKARLENPLTFFVFLSFAATVVSLRRRRALWAAGAGWAMALAFLVKGAPALVCLAVAGIGWLLVPLTLGERLRLAGAFAAGALLGGGPWLVAQFVVDDGRFFDWYVHRQVEWSLAGRPGSGAAGARGLSGLLFYSRNLFLEMMIPWGWVGVAGAIAVLRRRRWRQEEALVLAVVAALGVLGAFSLIPFRQARYVLPAFPFLALLAAEALRVAAIDERAQRVFARLLPALLVLLVAVATLTPVPFYSKKDGAFLPLRPFVDAATAPSDSLLVGGMGAYTVRQVFTWYFDRPHVLAQGPAEFEARWASGRFGAGIYRLDRGAGPGGFTPSTVPFARSGRYLLFLRDATAGSKVFDLHSLAPPRSPGEILGGGVR